jgi:hypothetical protein
MHTHAKAENKLCGVERLWCRSSEATFACVHLHLPYEHTQVGWVTLASSLLPLLLVCLLVPTVPDSGGRSALVLALGFLLVLTALFSTLSVRVDEQELRLHFGLGLVRRHFALCDIVAFREVTNPWQYGWGIRRYPGGVLYNVSGLAAIEFALRDGRRVRIGTDDPSTLFLALESQLGASRPMPEVSYARAGARLRRRLVIGLLVVALTMIGILMHVQAKPPVVTVTEDSITVENLFYGQQVAWADLQRAELMPSLPCILARTNGYAANGTIRGWFVLRDYGRAKLFVETSHPPFVALHVQDGLVIFNFSDPQMTLREYQSINQELGRRATALTAGHLH